MKTEFLVQLDAFSPSRLCGNCVSGYPELRLHPSTCSISSRRGDGGNLASMAWNLSHRADASLGQRATRRGVSKLIFGAVIVLFI